LCDASSPISHFRYGRNGIFSVRHTRVMISAQHNDCNIVQLNM